MKALTDKIIECLKDKHDHFIGSQKNNETQAENRGFKKGLKWAIGSVESVEMSAEFEEVARQLMKHMAEKYHPHHSAIVTSTNAELLQGEYSTGCVDDYLPD